LRLIEAKNIETIPIVLYRRGSQRGAPEEILQA